MEPSTTHVSNSASSPEGGNRAILIGDAKEADEVKVTSEEEEKEDEEEEEEEERNQ